MQLFQAILSTNNIKHAAEILGVHHEKIKGMIEAEGVLHEKGQRYKEAVQNFLDAGNPMQLTLDLRSSLDWDREDSLWEEELEVEIKQLY